MEYLKYYGDTDSEDEEIINNNDNGNNKKRSLDEDIDQNDEIPDLPDSFYKSNNSKNSDNNNDNNTSNKRIRLFEHVDGHYPTFIYFKIPINRNDIKELINNVKDIGNEIGITEGLESCFHISISRTFPIREHHIETYTKELKKSLSNVRSFDIQLSNECCVFINDNKSRIFLSIPLELQSKQLLLSLIKRIDKVNTLFKFPVYYEDPEPHLSISWSLLPITCTNNNSNTNITNTTTTNNKPSYENKEIIKSNLPITNSFKISTIFWNIGKTDYYSNLN